MKKRVLILLLSILLFSIFYVSSSNYYYNNYYRDYQKYQEHKINSRTFHITKSNGQSYYRTFTNYNKYKKDYNPSKTDFERKGMYLDFFDTEDLKSRYPITKKEMNCPEGWKCKK